MTFSRKNNWFPATPQKKAVFLFFGSIHPLATVESEFIEFRETPILRSYNVIGKVLTIADQKDVFFIFPAPTKTQKHQTTQMVFHLFGQIDVATKQLWFVTWWWWIIRESLLNCIFFLSNSGLGIFAQIFPEISGSSFPLTGFTGWESQSYPLPTPPSKK